MRVLALKSINLTSDCWNSLSRKLKRSFAKITILRPSAVSSAKEDNCAASANCSSLTPWTGKKSLARRFPNVMVPVLSSKRTSTSPAASIARPLMAMTFSFVKRLIPAIPIEDIKAPIVVGARQISKAITITSDKASPLPDN